MDEHAETLTPEEEEALYNEFREWVNTLAFGYGTADGAELIMLKRFYTPEDVRNVMIMPKDEFFTAEQYAEMKGVGADEARELLLDLAKRANIYRERNEDGVDVFHVIPYAHGIYEFHTRWLEEDWVMKGLYPHNLNPANSRLAFNAGFPFYHTLPCQPEKVQGGVADEDDIWKIMEGKRRFAVCPCDCLATTRDMNNPYLPVECDHPTGVCIQTDNMADYYLDDLQTGKEITLEQAKAIVEKSIEKGLVVQTTFSKKNEIICSCGLCHCGILKGAKFFPGDANVNHTRYRIEFDRALCVKDHTCVQVCPMQAISIDEETGFPVTDSSCVGCGQCVRACSASARVLVRKPEEEIHDYAQDMWESYAWMEQHRRDAGRL